MAGRWMGVHVRMRVRECVPACVRACVRACEWVYVCVSVCVCGCAGEGVSEGLFLARHSAAATAACEARAARMLGRATPMTVHLGVGALPISLTLLRPLWVCVCTQVARAVVALRAWRGRHALQVSEAKRGVCCVFFSCVAGAAHLQVAASALAPFSSKWWAKVCLLTQTPRTQWAWVVGRPKRAA